MSSRTFNLNILNNFSVCIFWSLIEPDFVFSYEFLTKSDKLREIFLDLFHSFSANSRIVDDIIGIDSAADEISEHDLLTTNPTTTFSSFTVRRKLSEEGRKLVPEQLLEMVLLFLSGRECEGDGELIEQLNIVLNDKVMNKNLLDISGIVPISSSKELEIRLRLMHLSSGCGRDYRETSSTECTVFFVCPTC